MRNLRKENQYPEGVNKSGHDRLGNKAHQPCHAQHAKQNLNYASHEHGGKNVLYAVLMHHGPNNQRHGTGRGRDHRRATTQYRQGKTQHHGSDQADLRVNARHDGK